MMDSVFIELTLTDNCNCNCKYCFEGKKIHKPRNLDIENRQLFLLKKACEDFSTTKYKTGDEYILIKLDDYPNGLDIDLTKYEIIYDKNKNNVIKIKERK